MKNREPRLNSRPGMKKLGRVLTGSFIVIMLIHIIVFTAIGLFTDMGWRLLYIFLGGLAVMLLVVWPLKRMRGRRNGARDCPDTEI